MHIALSGSHACGTTLDRTVRIFSRTRFLPGQPLVSVQNAQNAISRLASAVSTAQIWDFVRVLEHGLVVAEQVMPSHVDKHGEESSVDSSKVAAGLQPGPRLDLDCTGIKSGADLQVKVC